MALIDVTKNVNYTTLSSGAKTAVDTAATAIRAAFTAAEAEKKKENVRALLMELVRHQDKT
jgi:hypothetical protein